MASMNYPSSARNSATRSLLRLAAVLLGVVALAGCSAAAPAEQAATPLPPAIAQSERIDDPANYSIPGAEEEEEPATAVIPTPTPEPESDDDDAEPAFVIVTTQGSRANLRSAPTLTSQIVGKGNPGTTFEVVGRTDDGEWWEVCCLADAENAVGDATDTAWVAASVVSTDIDPEAVAISAAAIEDEEDEPLLPEELEAVWDVDWSCGSERCSVQQCTATVTASGTAISGDWTSVDHLVEWDDECFPPDQWVFEISRLDGTERTGDFADNFLYGYWLGREPGEYNGVYSMDDDLFVAVSCSDTQSVEINEGDGWTSVYEGQSCHDVATGVLVLLNYTKRWLYTGEYDGNTYDRAYFGDSERLEQRLVDTTVPLALVEPAE